jgi:hypothetical protein
MLACIIESEVVIATAKTADQGNRNCSPIANTNLMFFAMGVNLDSSAASSCVNKAEARSPTHWRLVPPPDIGCFLTTTQRIHSSQTKRP